MLKPFWRSSVGEGVDVGGRQRRSPGEKVSGLMWCKDLGQHSCGGFSMAVVQANSLPEDQSQLESGPLTANGQWPLGTFVGVYDGHGGPETSRFINGNLFRNIKKLTSHGGGLSVDVIKKAFAATEEDFITSVRKQWQVKPQMASVGSCCLVGIVSAGLLYVGNAGDSRAVLGTLEGRSSRKMKAVQLSADHNVNFESVREELRSQHPDDPTILAVKHGVWRVKGLVQVSRSIGDAYLKRAEFNREPLPLKFRVPEPLEKPILSWEPSVHVHSLQPEDRFIIFASDGLWEHLSNQEAVDIVNSDPRNGIAQRLIKAALKVAAMKREIRYSDMKKINRGVRRHFHDDITVIVLFIDPPPSILTSPLSIKGPW
ncbi:hypothetical protein SAY86_007361 [Trapa natans]|uniref:protein-serine/threonine phosphatase n=1 Tax=Trapa natans TaxID=22666 RepID=A0AAN7QXS7_TRANT|nr:hypothetical protein SAY86_007361 [Trapa natans]